MAGRGRPKVDDLRGHKISVRFSDKQLEVLDAYCEKHGLKKSQVLMKGFEELLRQDAEAEKSK